MSQPPLPKTPTAAAVAPTQGELPQTLGECHAVIDLLRSQLGQLQEQVMTLQERLKLDSSNSSKPPSSDGPGSGNRAQRRASPRKRGAQKGHKGHHRALLDEQEVQQFTDCKPAEVCECGAAVAAVAGRGRRADPSPGVRGAGGAGASA